MGVLVNLILSELVGVESQSLSELFAGLDEAKGLSLQKSITPE